MFKHTSFIILPHPLPLCLGCFFYFFNLPHIHFSSPFPQPSHIRCLVFPAFSFFPPSLSVSHLLHFASIRVHFFLSFSYFFLSNSPVLRKIFRFSSEVSGGNLSQVSTQFFSVCVKLWNVSSFEHLCIPETVKSWIDVSVHLSTCILDVFSELYVKMVNPV